MPPINQTHEAMQRKQAADERARERARERAADQRTAELASRRAQIDAPSAVPRAGLHDGQDARSPQTYTTAELGAVLAGDVDAFPEAATFEVPIALAELWRRAGVAAHPDAASEARDFIVRHLGPDPLDDGGDDAPLEVLERNGYAAIREAAIKPLQTIAGFPVDALDEAIRFAERNVTHRELSVDRGTITPKGREKLRDARRTLRYLEAAKKIGGDLRALEARIVASEVVV